MAERIGIAVRRVLERLERLRTTSQPPPEVTELAENAVRYAKGKDGARWSRDSAINWAMEYRSSLTSGEFFAVKQSIQKAWKIRHLH